jgi:hypothetical protein
MSTTTARWVRRLAAGAVLLALLSGCDPALVWLPDSSGFVYTFRRDGNEEDYSSIAHYDVAKGEVRTVVADTGTQTLRPAISPDGKRVAVAGLVVEPSKPRTMQIVVYDLDGKERHRSTPICWSPPAQDATVRDVEPTALFWAPKGEQLLVHDYGAEPRTGVYDLKKDRLTLLEGALPALFGGSPFRPDGKGFLLTRPREGGLDVGWMDWAGKEQAIAMKPDTVDSEQKRDMLAAPWYATSSWHGAEAVVAYSSTRIRIDTGKRTGRLEAVPREEAAVDGKVIRQRYSFAATGVAVCVLEEEVKDATHFRVQVNSPKGTTLDTPVESASWCMLFPSPNGKLVAVGCGELDVRGRNQDMILVIDQAGKVLGRLTVSP